MRSSRERDRMRIASYALFVFFNKPSMVMPDSSQSRVQIRLAGIECTLLSNSDNSISLLMHACGDLVTAQFFNLLYDKACIPACWKQAKLSPLYKKGPLLDPNNYRMLAVSGTVYRMYANVIHSLLTEWCVATGQIPDTQCGFYQLVTLCNPCSFFGTYNMLHEQ